jgi:hemoglobin
MTLTVSEVSIDCCLRPLFARDGQNAAMSGAADLTITPFEAFGGHVFFDRLVGAFYARVETDPVLRPMYPGHDLAPAEERLRLFLEQYWGGPGTYSEQRGHPRLRMRHAHFPIDRAAAARWLSHMRASLDEQELPAELDALLWDYFEAAAPAMINTDG